jgi:hypothetical protein
VTRAGTPPGRLPGHVTPLLAGSSGPPPDQCGTTTDSGSFPPNNSGTSAGTGNVIYVRPGLTYPVVPTPGYAGDWHFPAYGSAGSPDLAGDCSQNTLRFIFGGLGVATITMLPNGHNLQAVLQHIDGTIVVDAIKDIGPGGMVTFRTVACAPDATPYHWIDVSELAGPCGTKWGFVGATWTLNP